jgi:hypothetical protein
VSELSLAGENSEILRDRRDAYEDKTAAKRLRLAVFGGFGMRFKHCERIARLYSEMDGRIDVERTSLWCHSVSEMTIPRKGDRAIRRMVKSFNSPLKDEELIIHLHSGSVFIFFRMLPSFSDAARKSIRSVIFECSPMDCQAEQFGRFLSWTLKRNYGPRHALPFKILRPVFGINRAFESRHRQERLMLPVPARIHFIQCEDDPIVDPGYVARYREELDEQGHYTSLTSHRGARHCRARVDKPEEYRADISVLLQSL